MLDSRATSLELAELTLELCKIPSPTGREREVADFVAGRCQGAVGREAVQRLGNSVVCDPAAVSGSFTSPVVGLFGHLDTVECAAGQPLEIRGERVYGCGASDMKGGVAVMLSLLHRWRELRGRPVFVFYDKEEGPNQENGLEAVLESGLLPEFEFGFILEPTDGNLHLGCLGLLHATVTVPGRRAHSARPWQGENALYRAIPLLERLRDRVAREVEVGGLTFQEVVTATQAWTENSRNVIPGEVRFNLNARFAPGRTCADAERELRALVAGAGEVEVVDRAEAGEVHGDHPLILAWRRSEGLVAEPKQAWTDVARLTGRGIPAVNFGPGATAQAHQRGEWCPVRGLERCHAALLRFFKG
ncbi:MAG: succinyl-diaminopimelate desuccinylase [Longimicrobiaceae bacterium]